MTRNRCRIALLCTAGAMSFAMPAAANEPIVIGLVVKTEANPFFAKMKEGAILGATVHGAQVMTAAGKADGDTQTQIEAIDKMVAAGVKTIMITPNGKEVAPALVNARAKGVQVIALDSPTEPPEAANALFATNNYQAGVLIGRYAKAAMEQRFPGQKPRIVTLDLLPGNQTGAQRHNGFMEGMSLKSEGPGTTVLSTSPEIVCSGDSYGDKAKGLAIMEKCLQQDGGINLVYAINEPAAEGAYQALKAAGKDKSALIVAIDGGCPGIRQVENGSIAATVQQFPLTMAAMAVDAGVAYAKHGKTVSGYTDTGAVLITASPMPGVPSKPVQAGLEACFGPK